MKRRRRRLLTCVVLMMTMLALQFLMGGCNDDVHYSDDPCYGLTFSADTIAFDTLFTEVGSVTGVLQVYNPNDVSLNVSSIRLAGGWESPFRVNVDGQYGVVFEDVDMRAHDSLYVFVEVTIDPRGADELFEVKDSLLFTLNSGRMAGVVFTASGWEVLRLDGYLHNDTTLTQCVLVTDSLVVDSAATLTLEEGVTLFFHNKAYLRVDGTLKALGTVENPIVFRGDRLDRMFSYLPYDRVRGQWGGIVFGPTSHDNVLQHCDIHSCMWGITAGPTDMSRPMLTLDGTSITNVDGVGLQTTLCVTTAVNCLFANTLGHCVDLLGGDSDFLHCTLANFYQWVQWSAAGNRGETLRLRNVDDDGTFYPMPRARFRNCIITGYGDDEITGTVAEKTDSVDLSEWAQYSISHSLILSSDTANTHFTDIVWECKDSTICGLKNFRSTNLVRYAEFHPDTLSRALGIGDPTLVPLAPYDMDGLPRDTVAPAAGCYDHFGPLIEDSEPDSKPES